MEGAAVAAITSENLVAEEPPENDKNIVMKHDIFSRSISITFTILTRYDIDIFAL
jgi:hypothetical protein